MKTTTYSMYEYVMRHLLAAKGTWPTIAKDVGISRRTIEKIANREIANPGIQSMQNLHDYFRNGKKK